MTTDGDQSLLLVQERKCPVVAPFHVAPTIAQQLSTKVRPDGGVKSPPRMRGVRSYKREAPLLTIFPSFILKPEGGYSSPPRKGSPRSIFSIEFIITGSSTSTAKGIRTVGERPAFPKTFFHFKNQHPFIESSTTP